VCLLLDAGSFSDNKPVINCGGLPPF